MLANTFLKDDLRAYFLFLDIKKQIFSIPNLFGYFRILILPVIAWLYLNAKEPSDYYVVTGLLILSSCTDFLDGLIARKFHMITDIGKVLDPISDKLTQFKIRRKNKKAPSA